MTVKDNALLNDSLDAGENQAITNRNDLGEFCSIACLKAIITGLEDILGEPLIRTNLILAGRIRGRNVVNDLGLRNTDKPIAEWSMQISKALGIEGTRLCTLVKAEHDGDIIRVYLSDTVCSAGESPGSSRNLTFTQGVIQGAIEEATGRKLKGVQTGSVLRGQDYDIIEFGER